jgi:hypothetical protein
MTITPRTIAELPRKDRLRFESYVRNRLGQEFIARQRVAQRRRVLANAQRKIELGVKDANNPTVDR